MSYPICPANMPWVRAAGFHKTPHFNTITMKPAAGRGVVTASVCPYATWDFEVALSLAIGSEADSASILNAFLGMFLQCQGATGFFLFTDPQDNAISQANGTMLNVTPGAANPMSNLGDGTSTQFQLARNIGGGFDIIQNVNGTPTLYINGELTTAYSVSATGVISFVSAPASDATLQWGGDFYFLCQFAEDTLKDLARMFQYGGSTIDSLWDCGDIKFSSVFV